MTKIRRNNGKPWRVRGARFRGNRDCRDRAPVAQPIAFSGPCWLQLRRRRSCCSPQRGQLSGSAEEEGLPFFFLNFFFFSLANSISQWFLLLFGNLFTFRFKFEFWCDRKGRYLGGWTTRAAHARLLPYTRVLQIGDAIHALPLINH